MEEEFIVSQRVGTHAAHLGGERTWVPMAVVEELAPIQVDQGAERERRWVRSRAGRNP